MKLRPIHPFPARMAPDVALRACASLAPEALVLDPMSGSGTVLRTAAEHGLKAIGFDLDPWSVLLSRVWTTPVATDEVRELARRCLAWSRTTEAQKVRLAWIDEDSEAVDFVHYWFAPAQRRPLRQIAAFLVAEATPSADVLRVALGRLIIAKMRGASLGADISHSRPHKVREGNDFDVFSELTKATHRLCQVLESEPPPGGVAVANGDARNLSAVASASIDAVITSPPYLNAIDYIRGHRLALIWLGHTMSELRDIRSRSIGAERAPSSCAPTDILTEMAPALTGLERLDRRRRRLIDRFALDMYALMMEMRRVIKQDGQVVIVMGNSVQKGVFVRNTEIIARAASLCGFELLEVIERALPPNLRYLPMPNRRSGSLGRRMRTESVLRFRSA